MKRTMNEITTDIMVQQMNIDMSVNPEDLEIQLQELFTELYQKEDGIYWFYKENDKKIEMLKEHMEKCTLIKKRLQSTNEYMKQLVITSHQETDTLPKYSVFNPIKIKQSNGAVEIIDQSEIPDHYYKKVETLKLDKSRILSELKEGKSIKGVRLIKKPYVGGLK